MKIFKRSIHTPYFILLLMIFLYSCENIFQPRAEIPSYLNIEKIELAVTYPDTQGTASNKIVDAWVYVDDNLQGIYELPATFPVLKNGKNSLKILAGIKDNGISAVRITYPFFDFYSDNLFTFFSDSIMLVSPSVTYYPATKFSWIEDFEDPEITLDSLYPSYSKIKRITGNTMVFEGDGSGYVSLDEKNHVFKGTSNGSFVLPKAGSPVYLELNYKTSVTLNVIVVSNNPGGTAEDVVLVITPTNKSGGAEWNKIYVNLTPFVSGNPYSTDYKINFYSDIFNDGIISGEIYLDNIKLVHF